MEITPLEIANICSIFISYKSSKISRKDLLRYQSLCLPIDANNSPESILNYTVQSGILTEANGYVYSTDISKNLGKVHNKPNYCLSSKTKDHFIKNIILNSTLQSLGFVSCIENFQPKSDFGTYCYLRTYNESYKLLNWLKALNYLNLTYCSNQFVLINKDYLQILSHFLYRVRNTQSSPSGKCEDQKTITGERAELLAMEFEKFRLIKNGFPELANAIERLSLIDNYLGYDILSYQGNGKNPTKRRYIEVKGTEKNKYQFIFTRNERIVATKKGSKYWIYCFKNVKSASLENARPLLICNPISKLNKLNVYKEPIDIFYSFDY